MKENLLISRRDLLKSATLISAGLIVGCGSNNENATSQNGEPVRKKTPRRTPTPVDELTPPARETTVGKLESKERLAIPDFQKGFSVSVYSNLETIDGMSFQDLTQKILDRLVKDGVDSVSFVFHFYQDGGYASNVSVGDDTPSDENMRVLFREAKKRELVTTLKPLMDETYLHKDNKWRGSIEPENIDAWFGSYKQILIKYAKLADEEGVEVFSIGAELFSMEQYTSQWIDVIKSLREVFGGKIIYAFNHDTNGDEHFGFVPDLDIVGIDAYYSMDLPQDASVEEITQAWREKLQEAVNIKKQFGKPVLLSEVGITGKDLRTPWSWDTDPDPQALVTQRNYLESLCNNMEMLRETTGGLHIWVAYFEDPDKVDPNIPSFSIFNKPAERAVRNCYRQ